jgi:hypothetical protein
MNRTGLREPEERRTFNASGRTVPAFALRVEPFIFCGGHLNSSGPLRVAPSSVSAQEKVPAGALQVHTAPMRQIQTHIDIDAPASIVWAILADFGTYDRWNPLIRGILGRPAIGRQIEIRLTLPSGAIVAARPTIVHLREEREMRWLERWATPGAFTSDRRFRIEQRSEGGVRFHHSELTRGIVLLLLDLRRRLRGRSDLDAMNRALKLRAERAWAHRPPAGK